MATFVKLEQYQLTLDENGEVIASKRLTTSWFDIKTKPEVDKKDANNKIWQHTGEFHFGPAAPGN